MVVVLTPRGGRTGRRTFSRTVPVAERHTAGRHHLGTDLQSIIGWLQAHGSLLKILVQLRQHQGDAQAHPAGAGARYAAEARILRAGPRCINIQAGRLHVKPTAGLPGRRHRGGPFDNRTRTRRSGRLRPSSLTRGYKPRRGNLYVARPYSPDIAAATTELTGQDRERSPADGHRGAPGAAEAASAGAARAAASGTSVAPARTGPAEGPGAAAVPDRAGHYRDRGDGAVRRCLQPGTWPCDAASHHHWPRRQPRSAARPPWSAGAGDPRRARVPPPMPRPRPPGRRSASRPATPRSSSARKARSC